jgi:RNA polymerase sigma-70 factor (ECF subfamily)
LNPEIADDRKIIERVLAGDTNAFNLLVWQWEKPIYNYVLRMVRSPEDSMDLCQETFLKAFRELGSLKDRDRFSAWLYRIAHNVCFSRFRRDQGKTFVELDPEFGARRAPIENRLAVEKALADLPEDQREVVVLKIYQGLKFDEIARIQGAPVSTVKSRLYMGFEKLRSALGETGDESGASAQARRAR